MRGCFLSVQNDPKCSKIIPKKQEREIILRSTINNNYRHFFFFIVHKLTKLNKNGRNICIYAKKVVTSARPYLQSKQGIRRRYFRILPGIRAHKSAFFKQKRDKSLLSSICLSPPKASFQGNRQIDDNRIKFYFLLKKCTFICVCAKFVVTLQTF